MDFSPEQEREMIEKNMPRIYRAVDNFTARFSADVARVPYDDFVQEVAIAYIKYLRKCESPDQLNVFPWHSAMGAMRDLVLAYQPMSCPKSQHRFSEIIHGMPVTMSIDALSASSGLDIDGMSKHWVDDKETQIDFDIFMESQSENTRRVASMRIYGMRMKEIADQCGVSRQMIYKKFNKLNDQYKKYMESAEDE